MKLKSFNTFSVSESSSASSYKYQTLSGQITLYRLTSHSVVDLTQPGEYYVCDESAISSDILDNKGDNLYLTTVTCDADNIDTEKSQEECSRLSNPFIVAVKDESACEVTSIEPYKN
jgi:hypothetical protein